MSDAVWVHWENYGVPKMPGHLLGNSGTHFLLRSLMMRNVVRHTGEVTSLELDGTSFMPWSWFKGLKGMGKENPLRSNGATM